MLSDFDIDDDDDDEDDDNDDATSFCMKTRNCFKMDFSSSDLPVVVDVALII